MDLLLLLLERRQELVSRDDIAKRLWGQDVFIDVDAGIHTAILKIRQALGDSRESHDSSKPCRERLSLRRAGRGRGSVAGPCVACACGRTRASAEIRVVTTCRPSSRASSDVEKELLELPGVLASSRLLSLTGAGGVGKTRLALRLARDLVHEFPDGVWLVDLAPLSVPDLVAQTIATALGVREGPQRSARDALLDTLRDRELLLVLDNCEHLIAACAELVEALLRGAPALRILATSREALGVSGETVCRVPSLSLPEALASVPADALVDSEATQLFIERASAVDPAFTPTPDNADAIARICRRLDGIPLAIELAAARVVVLSPAQIEARLQDRFRLLTGGARTAVARQRTLEATVDWSYELLSDVERQLLSRLSVFPAAWTLEAAEHVCGGDGINEHDVLDLLSRLVSKSLVVVDGEFAGERRYRFLETVRQYARERLVQAGAADRLRERHFEFFFNEFRGVLPILRHHQSVAVSPAAADRAGERPGGARMGADLFSPGREGRRAGGRAVLVLDEARPVRGGKALARTGARGRFRDVPRVLRARALIGLAHMHHFQGRSFEAGALHEALALGREDGDAWVVSFALFMQALAAFERGDHRAGDRAAPWRRGRPPMPAARTVQHGGPLLILANIAGLERRPRPRAAAL